MNRFDTLTGHATQLPIPRRRRWQIWALAGLAGATVVVGGWTTTFVLRSWLGLQKPKSQTPPHQPILAQGAGSPSLPPSPNPTPVPSPKPLPQDRPQPTPAPSPSALPRAGRAESQRLLNSHDQAPTGTDRRAVEGRVTPTAMGAEPDSTAGPKIAAKAPVVTVAPVADSTATAPAISSSSAEAPPRPLAEPPAVRAPKISISGLKPEHEAFLREGLLELDGLAKANISVRRDAWKTGWNALVRLESADGRDAEREFGVHESNMDVVILQQVKMGLAFLKDAAVNKP